MAGIRLRNRKPAPVKPSFVIDPQEVQQAAYALYERRGRKDGNALEDWLKAEEMVRRRHAAQRGITVL